MALGGFTLADRLGAKSHPCRVAGCTRTWIELPGKALGLGGRGAAASDAQAGMCDPCRAKAASLADKERRCDTPGCQGRWVWPAKAQLEAFATNRQPPRGICADCEAKLAALEDKEVDCGIPGCTRKALVTKRAQLLAVNEAARKAEAEAKAAEAKPEEALPTPSEAAPVPAPLSEADTAPVATLESAEAVAPTQEAAEPASEASADASGAGPRHGKGKNRKDGGAKPEKKELPPLGKVTFKGPLCTPCFDVSKRLQDRPVSCGINGCKRKWIWKADEQIQAFAAGKPNEPPRRMCEECRAGFGKLVDREVRCRTSGCKKTWTWSRFDQLDACVANKPAPKAPSRMCDSCYSQFSGLKDIERPCRKSGCKRTWTDKRGAQLARLVRGKMGDPYPQYCSEHNKELGELEDREITCKTDGCTGTWTWTREQQLAAGVRPELREPRAGNPTAPAIEAVAGDVPVVASDSAVVSSEIGSEQGPEESATSEGAATSETLASGTADTLPSAGEKPGPKRPSRRERERRRRRQPQPPERLCGACGEFLKDRKTLEIPCQQCGTAIYWPPESQLQTHLGNWAAPALCGACKRDATERAREAAREALRHPEEGPHDGSRGAAEPTASAVETSAVEAAPASSPNESN